NGDYVLRDVGSANGTLLNGKLIEAMTPYTLSSGDQIHLGRLLFIFQASGDVSSLPTIRRPYTSLDHQWLRLDEAAPAQPPAVQQPAQQPVAMPSIPSTQRQPFMSGPLPAQPSVITGSLLASTGPTAALPAAHLRFTVFYPPDVAANSWYALLIYAHHENAAEAIHKDAALYQEDANEAPRREPMMSSQLLRGLPITVIPECSGIAFNPWRLTFRWQDEWHRLELRLSARREQVNTTPQGSIYVFVGPLLVARLPLEIAVKQPDIEIMSSDKDVSRGFFQHPFISYSRHDVAFRQACLNACRTIGCADFVNIEDLRPGLQLHEQVKHAIDTADVFQLGWSARASHTDYVTREWTYALQSGRGDNFICPVYWDVPHAPIPKPLAARRFIYLPAYTFNLSG
ncbi:MAG: TIR domain-containing protein, partial [Ktedonobacteraceae bacterium]|nr:TIR domain-containing protein [Ktedonobacteraceae bacterium]